MKRLLVILCCILFSTVLCAQVEEYKGFLLDKFQKGKVIYKKNQQATESNFNYETITEKMIFMLPDSSIFELARPDIVSVVRIGDRFFEHIRDGMFYEKVKTGDGFLYVRWKSRVISEGKPGPYGSKPGTGRIENVNQTTSLGGVYSLKMDESFKVEEINTYYIKQNNKFKRFDSFDSLAKQFKKYKDKIKTYVKDQNLSFKNVEDIEKAVSYAFSLSE